jgi:hypothetical protein
MAGMVSVGVGCALERRPPRRPRAHSPIRPFGWLKGIARENWCGIMGGVPVRRQKLALVCCAILSAAGCLLAGSNTVSIALSTNAWDMHTLTPGAVTDTWWESPGHFGVSNAGTVPINLMVSVTNPPSTPWTPGSDAGPSTYVMSASVETGGAQPLYSAIGETPSELVGGVETNEEVRFDLRFHAPRVEPGGAGMGSHTVRVTVTAIPMDPR